MLYQAEMLIRYVLYMVMFLLAWIIISPIFFPSNPGRSTKRFRMLQEGQFQNSRGYQHIRRLLAVTLQIRSNRAVNTFYLLSSLLFVVTLLFTSSIGGGFLFISVVSSFFGLLPYILLRLKLHSIRISSSYEGDTLVTELISQYKINYFNMLEAIDATILKLDAGLRTRKALMRLSLALKESGSPEAINHSITEFIYSIDTNWSKLLGTNLYLAIVHQDDVTDSLEDILDELINLRKLQEENKQENSEAYFMIKFAAPAIFALTIWLMFAFLDMTIQQYIENQFKHPMGFEYFIYCVVGMFANIAVYLYTHKPKNDF